MTTKITNGYVITKNEIIKSDVYLKGGKILAVTNENIPFDKEINADGMYVSPAFIDTHIHGAVGYDFLDADCESYIKIAEAVAKHGAGTIYPTITSSDEKKMRKSIEAFEEVKNIKHNGANMPGIHLEGPYFSPNQAGAQDPEKIRAFDKKEYEKIFSYTDSIVRWTGAPELEGSEEFAKTLVKRGGVPCIGHSDADSLCVEEAFKNGFSHITHLYSCTSTVHRKNAYRYAGIVEASYLNDDMSVEIIADGIHLPADLLKLVFKIKGADRTVLITDSMRGAGERDGESILGAKDDGLRVIIEDGVAKLPDRSAFAGSVAFCDRLVRNMINMAGVSLFDAVKMITRTPANIFNIKNKGIIEENFDADIVIFDENIDIKRTIIGGETVFVK